MKLFSKETTLKKKTNINTKENEMELPVSLQAVARAGKTAPIEEGKKQALDKGSVIVEEKEEVFEITEEMFGKFLPYVKNEQITDIDFNGRDLWLTYIDNHREKIPAEENGISKLSAEKFAQHISDATGQEFNQCFPSLEGETKVLRISVMHESICKSGISICIRKTPPFARITERYALESNYCSREVLSLLANCVKAHMNIVVAGEPRAGKTEACKFLAMYIPNDERVITIEDTLEWRYNELKPFADGLQWKVHEKFDYAAAIVSALKQNPKWIMVAETRGVEVKSLIQGFSTGVHGMTTLHTEDVRKIPQRMLNMVDDSLLEKRLLNNIYDFVDVGILISIRTDRDGNRYRMIDQVGFFSNDNEANMCQILVSDGLLVPGAGLAQNVLHKFRNAGIADIFQSDVVDEKLKLQGFDMTGHEVKYQLDTDGIAFVKSILEEKTTEAPEKKQQERTRQGEEASSGNSLWKFKYQNPEERLEEHQKKKEEQEAE